MLNGSEASGIWIGCFRPSVLADVSCWTAAKHPGRGLVGMVARAQASCAPTNYAVAPLVRGW